MGEKEKKKPGLADAKSIHSTGYIVIISTFSLNKALRTN
jgi:hypothetical protein